jgi:ferritin-like metal-binding protein YciE
VHQLRDIYYAEQQLVKALPKMAEKATDKQLKQGFLTHLNSRRFMFPQVAPCQASKCYALRSAKCAPLNAITAPRQSAASPASTPDIVGSGLGAEAAWPALASTSTPIAMRNCRIRGGICPDTALSINVAVK